MATTAVRTELFESLKTSEGGLRTTASSTARKMPQTLKPPAPMLTRSRRDRVFSRSCGSSCPLRPPRSRFVFVLVSCLATTVLYHRGWGVANAVACKATTETSITVSPSSDPLEVSSHFDCEGGDFNVIWSGVVNVQASIKIGKGTTVSISGDHVSDVTAADASSSFPAVKNSTASSAVVGSNNVGPIFLVQEGTLNLAGIVVREGIASTYTSGLNISGGGVAAMNATVTVTNCMFEDNFAEWTGGAIFANWSTVEVRDTIFRTCNAGEVPVAGQVESPEGAGGGIGVEYSDLFVDNCLFQDNFASKKGGALHGGNVNLSVKNSIFLDNSAGGNNVISMKSFGEGGDMVIAACVGGFDNVKACTVNGSHFANGHVAKKGGSVQVSDGFLGSSYVEFHSCEFLNASAGILIEDDPQGEGGTFSVGGGATLVLVDTVVTDSYAGKKGGAIVLSSGADFSTDPGGVVILKDSTFIGSKADRETGGVIYGNEFSEMNITGDRNEFISNRCGTDGAVLAASKNTKVVVEGGNFTKNFAEEDGGVFWTEGHLTICNGLFGKNKADERGGVFIADEGSIFIVENGTFGGKNGAGKGGVGVASEGSTLFIKGGIFAGNKASNGGGVFYVEEDTTFEITGGTFSENEADFGGFLYKEGEGTASCTGALIERSEALDGGALYLADSVELDWGCDLIDNKALVASAIYARGDSVATLTDVGLRDNVVARGSTVFLVSSELRTYQVVFSDDSKSADLSAVQADGSSVFKAQDTSFVGFEGEAIIFNEGKLVLDGCDFSKNSASVLVFTDDTRRTIVRNAILGDLNYAARAREASDAGIKPDADSIINVKLMCSRGDDEADDGEDIMSRPCSDGSLCMEGDLGVYCECYVPEITGSETCIGRATDGLSLIIDSNPSATYHPELLEGSILLTLPFSEEATPDTNNGSGGEGVIWNASAFRWDNGFSQMDGDVLSFMDWQLLPSSGLLFPGDTIPIYVVSSPTKTYDGEATVTFRANAMGFSPDSMVSKSSADVVMETAFYHCEAGNVWGIADGEDEEKCHLCTVFDMGDPNGLDCSLPGVSTTTLPVKEGYWRARINVTVIRKCYNQEACKGGQSVTRVQDYCHIGYTGPFCAICSPEYGRGVSKACHECNSNFKSAMIFLIAVAALFTLIMVVLIAAYLIGGVKTVTWTITNTKESMAVVRQRGSDFITSVSKSGPKKARREGESSSADMPDVTTSRISTNSFSFDGVETDAHLTAAASVRGVEIPENHSHNAQTRQADNVRGGAWGEKREDMEIQCQSSSSAAHDELGEMTNKKVCGRLQAIPRRGVMPAGKAPEGANSRAKSTRSGTSTSRSVQEKEEDTLKVIAKKVGELRAKLPLSKLKIVIVLWQISSAFGEVTQVPFPPIYKQFLSVVGIFTFDLSWLLSASCINTTINFYHQLLMVTLGPMILLGLLGITFYVGFRRQRSSSHDGVTSFFRSQSRTRINTDITHMASSPGTQRHRKRPRAIGQWSSITFASWSQRTSAEKVAGVIRNSEDSTRAVAPDVIPAVSRSRSIDKIREKDTLSDGEQSQSIARGVRAPVPGGYAFNSAQERLWGLFSRHTTITLAILYLVYSSVSTTVLRTFACMRLMEVNEEYLTADFRIRCDTEEHRRYEAYAVVMILIYPIGIPAAFLFILLRQRSSLNPRLGTDEQIKDKLRREDELSKKMERRQTDQSVAPTSFLWLAYYPDRYYFEVCECIRRLLLTGILVFLQPYTTGQVAISCIFAFLSLLWFEYLQPFVDRLDMQLYRTGCLVIFFSNFFALMIKSEVADPESTQSTVYAVVLIAVHILLVLSIWWNAWVAAAAVITRPTAQDAVLGFEIINKRELGTIFGRPKDTDNTRDINSAAEELEDLEAPPSWKGRDRQLSLE